MRDNNIDDHYTLRNKPGANVYTAGIFMMPDGPTIFAVKSKSRFFMPHYTIAENFPELENKESEEVIDLGVIVKEKGGTLKYVSGSHGIRFDPESFVRVENVDQIASEAIAAGRIHLKQTKP